MVYEVKLQLLLKQIFEFVVQQLVKVGVEFLVKFGDVGSYVEDMCDLFKIGFYYLMVGCVDFDVIKSQYFMKNCDVLILKDVKFDELLFVVVFELDVDKCVVVLQVVQDYIVEQVYVILLFEELQVYGIVIYVYGVVFELVGCLMFFGVWLVEY